MENALYSASCAHPSALVVLMSPFSPPKIRSVKILDNPFDDIIPRITAAEKRAQQVAKDQAIKEREEAARKKNIKKWVSCC